MKALLASMFAIAACGPGGGGRGAPATPDASSSSGPDSNGGGGGSGGGGGDYLVYAHADHVLYNVNIAAKTLVVVGPFNAPSNDVITDLAVAPSGVIYAISETNLYTADPNDGHVTLVGSLSACGTRGVALTTTPDGRLWTGDYSGKLCEIDITGTPVVKPPITMGSGMALSGDMVAVDTGTVYGTAYKLSDGTGGATAMDNVLVTIDLATGAVTQLGASGFPKLFGAAFQNGEVFGFTHDQTGRVVTIDRTTGAGTLFATFNDPSTNMPISFAGAGVSSLVVIQ